MAAAKVKAKLVIGGKNQAHHWWWFALLGIVLVAGGTFMLKWGPKPVSELFGVILQTMPPTARGSLGCGTL